MRLQSLKDRALAGSRPVALAWPPEIADCSARRSSGVWTAVFGLVLLALWSVLGRYQGIGHDAVVYALQAIARLHPDPLSGDVFLRYQSQDRFTVFPLAYAYLIDVIGVDRAAASLTFAFQVGWYAAACGIARRMQSAALALLSLALLLFLPRFYGAMEVFRYAEPFLTARIVAEALSLAALLCWVASRRGVALACIALALLVHPLMAFPVALVMAVHQLPLNRFRSGAILGIVIVVGAACGGFLIGQPEPYIQGEWLEAARQRSGFLFTDLWGIPDWETQVLVLATLGLAAMALPIGTTARRLAASALLVAIAGLTLAILSSQWLELKVLLQGQPWRWPWIGKVLAIAMLPSLVVSMWRAGAAGRAASLLLAISWLLAGIGALRELPPFGVAGLLCSFALVLWTVRDKITPEALRHLRILVVIAPLLVVVFFASVATIAVTNNFSFGYDPFWVQRVHDVLGTPGIAAAIAAFAWYLLIVARSQVAGGMCAIAAAALLYGAGPEYVRRWVNSPFDDTHRQQMLEWRQIIPQNAEVLWSAVPHGAWLLLDRRSYISISQGAGSVFSDETTKELLRRADVLSPLVSPGFWFLEPKAIQEGERDLTPEIMHAICKDPTLGFVIHKHEIAGAVGRVEWPGPGYFIHLYDCRKFRTA